MQMVHEEEKLASERDTADTDIANIDEILLMNGGD